MSKFGKADARVEIERVGPLRAFERLCVAVIKLLDEHKNVNPVNMPSAVGVGSSGNAVPLTLDGLKIQDRESVREQIMKELEKDFVSIKKDLAHRGHASTIDKTYAPETYPINVNNQASKRPSSKSIRELTMFSHDGDDRLEGKRFSQPPANNWEVQFKINKPPLPDFDPQADLKYKDRDPRRNLKYFSIDESSSLLSQEYTQLNFRRRQGDDDKFGLRAVDAQKESPERASKGNNIKDLRDSRPGVYGSQGTFQRNADNMLGGGSAVHYGIHSEDRDAMAMQIREAQEKRMQGRVGDINTRVDALYGNILRANR